MKTDEFRAGYMQALEDILEMLETLEARAQSQEPRDEQSPRQLRRVEALARRALDQLKGGPPS